MRAKHSILETSACVFVPHCPTREKEMRRQKASFDAMAVKTRRMRSENLEQLTKIAARRSEDEDIQIFSMTPLKVKREEMERERERRERERARERERERKRR
jgi:hypothetical protein